MSNVGVMVGALASGPAGDRLGRKPVILTSLLFLGVFSFATAYAGSITMLAFLRFMTGIGIGALMPSTVALTSDYAPDRLRATVTMWVFAGNPLGGFLGGQLIAALLPIFGWQVIFHIGGALPLLLFPVLLLWLPKSPRFLLTRGQRSPAALRIFADHGHRSRRGFGRILRARSTWPRQYRSPGLVRRRIRTAHVLFWIMFFASLLSLYLIGFWLPTVLHLEGLLAGSGCVRVEPLFRRWRTQCAATGPARHQARPERVLTACLACGIIVIAAVALATLPYLVLLATIFIMGMCVVGGQLGANGLSAAKYPARIRTTGVGWALGIGRLGGIFGPGLGGFLLAQGWQAPHILLCACLTAAIAAICVVLMQLPAAQVAGEPILRRT